MFSKKYQEDLYEEKYKSMKQLDRLEFHSREIIFNNNKSNVDCFYILSFISMFFSLGFISNYIYLASLGINSLVHISMGRVCAIISIYFMIFYFVISFCNLILKSKHKRSQEQFLEEHSK